MAVDTKAVAKVLRDQADLLDPPVVTPPTTPPTTPQFTDLPGWKLQKVQTFDTACAEGKFLDTYKDMGAYPTGWKDTSKHGTYSTDRLSAKDGNLLIHVGHRNGVPGGAVPYIKGPSGGQLDQAYGRYLVRMKADAVANYKVAFLLWPQSDQWNDGEIDFPEGNLNGSVQAFSHFTGDPTSQTAFSTGAKLTDWHEYITEWEPGAVRFYVDGKLIGTATKNIPTKPMHWVLQTETALGGSAPTSKDDGY